MSDTTPITGLVRLCEIETQDRNPLTELIRKLTSLSRKKRSVSQKEKIREDLVLELFYDHDLKDQPKTIKLIRE